MIRGEGMSNRMADKNLTPMEMDALGEVMNISLGSSATAVSNMLDHRVQITTPKVSVSDVESFSLGELQPAIGVEIRYISGLEGSNIMLLKRSDVKVIVDILMGSETSDDEFELNDLTISAVCEVMNQMMGAASTALSDFLGKPVNISTPESFELTDFDQFKQDHFPADDGKCVIVAFSLNIEGVLESRFINVMSMKLARELLQGLDIDEDPEPQRENASAASDREEMGQPMNTQQQTTPQIPEVPPDLLADRKLSQDEIGRLVEAARAEQEQASASSGTQPSPQPQLSPQSPQPGAQVPPAGAYPIPPYGQYMPGYYPFPYYPGPVDPKVVNARPAELPHLADGERPKEQQGENLNLLMSVPLEVSVEIGRTHKKVQDILAFTKGSLVVLDKLAGDQVDLFVNGQCIARGDVVVIDDNFGIRITEVLNASDLDSVVRE